MISQISSVVSWCTHCFVWCRGALSVIGVWSQNWGVLQGLRGAKYHCRSAVQTPIHHKRPSFRIPYLRPSKCRPLCSDAWGACPLRPLFAATVGHFLLNRPAVLYEFSTRCDQKVLQFDILSKKSIFFIVD